MTLVVPVNLTGLFPTIKTVSVTCSVAGAGAPVGGQSSVSIPVVGGRVITTVHVDVALTVDLSAGGHTASYGCWLGGTDDTGDFTFASDYGPPPSHRITPGPTKFAGSFTW